MKNLFDMLLAIAHFSLACAQAMILFLIGVGTMDERGFIFMILVLPLTHILVCIAKLMLEDEL